MSRTVEVIYDGEVLRPQEPLDLQPNTRYRVTIEEEPEFATEAFTRIVARARDLGVKDLSRQLDHYLYGTPKR